MTAEPNPFQPPHDALTALIEEFQNAYSPEDDQKAVFTGTPASVIRAVKNTQDVCSPQALDTAAGTFNAVAERRAEKIKHIKDIAAEGDHTPEENGFLARAAKYHSTFVYASYAAGLAGESMLAPLNVLPAEIRALLEIERREKKAVRILVPVSAVIAAGALYPFTGWWSVAAGVFTGAVGWGSMTLFSAVRTYLKRNLAEQYNPLLKYFENALYLVDLFRDAREALNNAEEGESIIDETIGRISASDLQDITELREPLGLLIRRHDIMFRFMNRMISTATMAAASGNLQDACARIFTPEIIEAVRPDGPTYPGSTSGN